MKVSLIIYKDKKRVFLFLSFLFLIYQLNAITASKDSLKSRYDINDPRNPNCPCHQYQKLADEEYKKWLKLQAKEQGVAIITLGKRDDKIRKSNRVPFLKFKNRRRIQAHPRFKKMFDFKRYRLWKRITETDACFHW